MIGILHKAWKSLARRRALRRSLTAAAAILGIVLIVAFLLKQLQTLHLESVGFRTLDENAAFQVTRYPDYHAFSISGDGRWLAMRLDIDNYSVEEHLFFDLRRNRFVAELDPIVGGPIASLPFPSNWRPDRCPVMLRDYQLEPPGKFQQWISRLLRRPIPKDRDFTLYLADIPAMKARLVLSERFEDGANTIPNRSLTALFFERWRYESGKPITEHRIYDLRRWRGTSYRRWEPDGRAFVLDWLDDDRTLAVLVVDWSYALSKERIELLDANRGATVRTIPYGKSLEQFQKDGVLEPGKVQGFYNSRIFQGPCARFDMVVRSPGQSGVVEEDWSVWDVHLDTGATTRVMKLDWCERYLTTSNDLVYSPSGKTVVAPVTTSSLLLSTIGTSITVAACTADQRPRVLPLHLRRFYYTHPDNPGQYPEGITWASSLRANMTFLDENALIYRGADNALWRYDMHSSEPVCLWSPHTLAVDVAPGDKAIIAGRVIDKRGRPVPDRFLRLASRPEPKEPFIKSKTDLAGRFRIVDVPPGSYRLEVGVDPKRCLQFTQVAAPEPLVVKVGECISGIDFVVEVPE